MLARLHFYINLIVSLPFLPLLYIQGKKAKAAVPELDAAQNQKGAFIQEESQESINIISLGESAFAGVGLTDHEKCITGILARSLAKKLDQNICWEVIAKSGYNATQVKKELVPLIPDAKVNLIVIGLGANDTFELHFPNKWEKDMKALITAIRQKQRECPIVIAHLPPVNQFPVLPSFLQWFMGNFIQQYHIVNQHIAKELTNVFYINQRIDFHEWTGKLPVGYSQQDLFCDGVHPGELAHGLWGNEIADFVFKQQLLKQN